MNEREIFAEAMQIAATEKRVAFLDRACGDDAELRKRVGGLLDEREKLGSFLEVPTAAAAIATVERPVSERVGKRIGRYRLLEQIGEGGMGTVWVAEQTEPVKRRVALKLIKPGMDSRQVLSRFEAERQALALMDHPNIAKVYDGGMTDEGRPYFVMEYVKGVPITGYCDNARLSIEERLRLFIPVCQAVQHAHQKGIIHRDLKPSNILVCLYDGQPVPKVIDFGLAKAVHQPLTEQTLYTAHGLMVGTPLYMSPEQAELNNLDVDTRSDVYSLGVILYELLTGSTPLESRQLKDAALQEILRLIKEVEPQRPSLKLSTSASLPSIAAQRRLEPANLSRVVRGDLDWIVMKSLEKERSRRYETANGLASDIERYLSNEPIHARPPSTTYRLRKFAQRNKATVAACTLIAASLLIGTGVSTWLAIRATNAEHLAQERLIQEGKALADATTARQETARELTRAVKAEKESQANLLALQQVAREWATSETLTGDPKRADAAIQLAEAANVSKAWTEILRAQSEIDQGRYESALRRITPVAMETYPHGNNDTRLAALSLLAYANYLSGGAPEFLMYMQKVYQLESNSGPEARLFMALAQSWPEPEAALQTLDGVARQRMYPALLLARANARSLRALQLRDSELLSGAISDLKYAELFTGDTRSLLLGKLEVQLAGYETSLAVGDSVAAELHLKEMSSSVKRLDGLPRSLLSTLYELGAYDRLNDFEKARNVCKSVDWGSTQLIEYPACYLYEHGGDARIAMAEFEKLQVNKENPYRLISQAHFLVEIVERRDELPDLYKRIKADSKQSPLAMTRALDILALMGEHDALKTEAKKALDQFAGEAKYWGIDEGLRYLSGEWDENRAVRESKISIDKECPVHYAIGIERLSKGDRNGAKEHFNKAVETRGFAYITFYWAKAYLDRMARDPSWPDWIEKSP